MTEAEAYLRSLLQQNPESAIAWHDLGILAYKDGRHAVALELMQRALQLQPDHVAILKSYGQILRETGKLFEALEAFLHVLDLEPRSAEVWNAAGVCFQESGNSAKAIESYLRASALKPDFIEAFNNMGIALLHEGDAEGAIDSFRQVLALSPDYADAWSNIAVAYRQRLEYEKAIEAFRKAFQLKPTDPNIAGGLGEILSLVYNEAAEDTLRQALALAPTDPERHWNLGLELLKRGKYPEGWREYEWRWKRGKGHNTPRPFAQPFWLGEPGQDIRGTTILLHAEQGFGDTLQMLRYVPLVLSRGANVLLEVQPELKRLVSTLPSVLRAGITVLGAGDPLPAFDWHTALLSLPLACGTTIDTIPPPVKLTATPSPESRGNRPLRIGLAWAGNPAHVRDRERSLLLEILKPLFEVPGCSWVSLQTGTATQQIQRSGLSLEQPPLHDFADTAAVIDTLDLIISVDSAVAHLAATQGVPTWILLPFVADWRWLLPPKPGEPHITNPWYPQARLFRQTDFPTESHAPTRWKSVITTVESALRKLAASS